MTGHRVRRGSSRSLKPPPGGAGVAIATNRPDKIRQHDDALVLPPDAIYAAGGWCAPIPPPDFTSDIEDALAAEEHRLGVPLVTGHCASCDTTLSKLLNAVTPLMVQAQCPHTHKDTIEIMTMGGSIAVEYTHCEDCGAPL